tara:strand:- start:1001 stop:1591 length:591 start_codon:yes stop_codon:yes gene_type:complete
MKRQEYKFLINRFELNILKKKLKLRKKYKSRKINSYYFDTIFLKDFVDSEEGTVPRKKLRFRWYGKKQSNIGNFEIKVTEDLLRKKEKITIENFDLEIKNILKKFKPNYYPIIKVSYNRDYFISNISNLDMNYDTNIIYERLAKNYEKTSKIYDFNNIFEIKDNLNISPDNFLRYINHKRIRFSKYSEGIKKLNLS